MPNEKEKEKRKKREKFVDYINKEKLEMQDADNPPKEHKLKQNGRNKLKEMTGETHHILITPPIRVILKLHWWRNTEPVPNVITHSPESG